MAGLVALPRLASVSVTDSAAFFPAGAPSIAARDAIDRLFPGAVPQSQVVLVLETKGPIEAQRDAVTALAARLRALDSSEHVASVLAPTDDPVLAERLVSERGDAALLVVRLSVGYMSEESAPVVAEVERIAADTSSAALRVSVSGDATLGRDYNVAIEEGGLRATTLTLGLVAVILLWVYGSPVVAALSIVTLGLALATTFALVVGAASLGLPVAYQIRAFLVAIVYGVGTDYCLLLFSRVREEHATGSGEGMRRAWRATLPVLLASGAAVSAGTALMAFADFGLFRFCGPALAIGVVTTLAATLTLAPALMQLVGRHLFWPRRPGALTQPSPVWPAISRLVLARPVLVLGVLSAALAPLVMVGVRATPSFDVEIDVPENSTSQAGYAALKRHFDLAASAPVTLALEQGEGDASPGFRSAGGLDALDQLGARLASRPGIARVSGATRPTGEPGLLARGTLASQLAELRAGLEQGRTGAAELASGLGTARREIAAGRRELSEKERAVAEEQARSLLAAFAPERFEDARRDLLRIDGDLGVLEGGVGTAEQGAGALAAGLARATERLRALQEAPGADRILDRLVITPGDIAASPDLRRALDFYVTAPGDAARFELELTSAPNSAASVRVLNDLAVRLPVMLETLGLGDTRAWLGGSTALTADLERLTHDDMRRVGGLVTVGMFVLLLVLLRGVAASAAVTLWLLVSYASALGALELGVRAGLWTGIDWKTPFFLFVLLVSIGADYGVFLLGRMREEETRAAFAPALARTLAATGPVITSCGVVLAGTFGALLLARIAFLEQVGAGVTVGVLVDTLVVRPFLLPASVILLRRGAAP